MGITVDELLSVPFETRRQDEQLKIVAEGKPRPNLEMTAVVTVNPTNGKLCTSAFSPTLYNDLPWLTGCEKRNTFFCWPCLLFSAPGGLWNSAGVSDLGFFIEDKSRHEESLMHLRAKLKLDEMVKISEKRIATDVREHNDMVKRNRAILRRMIDVVCNLITKEQPSYERIKGCLLDPENCVKNLKFLRAYDVLNNNYIEDAIDLIQITPNIVNDLVNTIARGMKMAILKEIQQSTYVSVILSDHSKTVERTQISTVLRYIKGGKVCERFVGFYNMGNQKTMPTVYGHILNVINEFSLPERFLAISLDGGVLQPTELVELTTVLKNVYPFAFFVPWYGHGLDHVLQQSLANMKECSAFFKAINEMKVFFQKKSKRFKAFETLMTTSLPETKEFKWFIRSQFISVLNRYRKYFFQFFESMLQSSTMWEPDDISKASGFLQILDDFDTVFLLVTFSKLFECTVPLNKMLKGSSPEKVFTTPEIKKLSGNLKLARDAFGEVWDEVHQKKNGGEQTGPYAKKIKLDMDDPQVTVYKELYDSIINRMLEELDVRLESLNNLNFCQLLTRNKTGSYIFSNDMIRNLMAVHGAFFDEEQIRNELMVLRTNGTIFAKKSVYDMLDFFIQSKLKGSFKYLYKLAEFVLTLPLKPPTELPCNSKIKEVRDWSYIPQTPGQQSGDIGIPCVELEFLQELKKSNTFHDEIAVIFHEGNKAFELIPR